MVYSAIVQHMGLYMVVYGVAPGAWCNSGAYGPWPPPPQGTDRWHLSPPALASTLQPVLYVWRQAPVNIVNLSPHLHTYTEPQSDHTIIVLFRSARTSYKHYFTSVSLLKIGDMLWLRVTVYSAPRETFG